MSLKYEPSSEPISQPRGLVNDQSGAGSHLTQDSEEEQVDAALSRARGVDAPANNRASIRQLLLIIYYSPA